MTDKIASFLDERKVPYLRGLVWTTDALFRETADRVEQRKAEGAKIVEMEQAGCIPVAYYNDFWLQSPKITGIWHSATGYWYMMYADVTE